MFCFAASLGGFAVETVAVSKCTRVDRLKNVCAKEENLRFCVCLEEVERKGKYDYCYCLFFFTEMS